ncbi:MAG: DNA repair protein RadA [Lachnospira sp.]|nr:DNA repair protein RadA [Lachnospira sp.]
MAKAKSTAFFCGECGYESAKWMGQCPACKQWNTFTEQPVTVKSKRTSVNTVSSKPVKLSSVTIEDEDRMSTGYVELDRVLGGGIVKGSLILVGGDPGIGKSTLLLQMCRQISNLGKNVLYVSGEESLKQIKMRASRIGEFTGDMQLLCENNLDTIEDSIRECMPQVVIIDSIQTMYKENIDSAQGSISQVRESTNVLMQLAKGLSISIFIVGHVTKEGVVAGPRVLEHMVDTVLYFEGDKNAMYRILRAVKNRFGSTNEIGVFEMKSSGLEEILNPSEYMLEGRPKGASGTVVACYIEGTRPMLIEIQALVTHSNLGIPRRTSAGADYNRVNLLMAVIEKRLNLQIGGCDAYVNIAGGIKINDPSVDLALVAAIISSYKNREIPSNTMIFGEVGLSGEVRSVSMAENRVQEAIKLGFDTVILPKGSLKLFDKQTSIKLIGVENIRELADLI